MSEMSQFSNVMNVSRRIAIVFVSFLMAACASIPEGTQRSKVDPWEPMNRNIFEFNQKLDKYALKPVSQTYQFVVPEFFRDGISNMFSNISDVYTAGNNVLQGKPKEALDDVCRVIVNTTFGIAGFFDVASQGGIDKHKEDFGLTLGHWGIGNGPYLVLPVLGESSVRDTVGWVVDIQTDILLQQVSNIPVRNSITALRLVDIRTKLLGATDLLDEAAFDKYTFTRDAYLQRRYSRIYDGNPPPVLDDDDTDDSSTANPSSTPNQDSK